MAMVSFVSHMLNFRQLLIASEIKMKIDICFNVYHFSVEYFQDKLRIVPKFCF